MQRVNACSMQSIKMMGLVCASRWKKKKERNKKVSKIMRVIAISTENLTKFGKIKMLHK